MHLGRVALEVFGGLVEVFEYSLGVELDVAVYEDVPEASQTLMSARRDALTTPSSASASKICS